MKEIGYAKEYRYPHEFKDNFVEEDYLPKELASNQYYIPSVNGQEKKLKDWLKFLWKAKKKY
jgi:putative ATPase